MRERRAPRQEVYITHCPECAMKFRLEESDLDEAVDCPQCLTSFRVSQELAD